MRKNINHLFMEDDRKASGFLIEGERKRDHTKSIIVEINTSLFASNDVLQFVNNFCALISCLRLIL